MASHLKRPKSGVGNNIDKYYKQPEPSSYLTGSVSGSSIYYTYVENCMYCSLNPEITLGLVNIQANYYLGLLFPN